MPKVEITLKPEHPLSNEFRRAHPIECPHCLERLRQARAKLTLLCPECCGGCPPDAWFCPWCRCDLRALAR